MLAGGLDQLYRDALARPHTVAVRVEVWRSGVRIDDYGKEGLPYAGGNVSCTLRSRTTRDLSITFPDSLVPYLDEEDGLLTTPGTFLRVLRGIELGNGLQYMWPVFYGMISRVDDPGDGTIQIDAFDRAQEISYAKFRAPRASSAGSPVRVQFQELIEEVIPEALFDISGISFTTTMPAIAWEYDRARALDEIATSVGALWWAKADGTFTLRPTPWATLAAPLLTLTETEGGTVNQFQGGLDFDGVVNSVTAYGERADGDTPVWSYVENTTGLTRANGPIGRRQRLVRLQTPQTQSTVQGAALTYLRRGAGIAESWSWSQPVDCAMELGDAVLIAPKRRRQPLVQVVSSYTIPLKVEAQMTVTGRAMTVGVSDLDDAG